MARKKQLKKKSRTEFSQKLVIVSWIVTIIWISLSFVLAFFDKDTNSEVTVALITESFGVTIGYLIYQASLKMNRNKYGIDASGIPYKVRRKLKEIYNETTESSDEGVG